MNGFRNRRARRTDSRDCSVCHLNNSHDPTHKSPMFASLDLSHVTAIVPPSITREHVVASI